MDSLPTDLSRLVDNRLTANQSVLFRYHDVEHIDNVKKAIETKDWKWILEYTRDDKTLDQIVYEKAYAKSCQYGLVDLMAIFEQKIKVEYGINNIKLKYFAKGSQFDLLDEFIAIHGLNIRGLWFIYEGLVIANEVEIIKSRKYSSRFDKQIQEGTSDIIAVAHNKLSYRLGKHNREDILKFLKNGEPLRIYLVKTLLYYGRVRSGHPIDETEFSKYLDRGGIDYALLELIGKNSQYHGLCEQMILSDENLAKPYFVGLLLDQWYQRIESILENNQSLVSIALKASTEVDDIVIFSMMRIVVIISIMQLK